MRALHRKILVCELSSQSRGMRNSFGVAETSILHATFAINLIKAPSRTESGDRRSREHLMRKGPNSKKGIDEPELNGERLGRSPERGQ
jgi:hypothetical protein